MNIYISNLGNKVTDESLRAVFATYGRVSSSKVIVDGATGYSSGFASVEMPNDAEAFIAIRKIDGCVIDGSSIAVAEGKRLTFN